MQVKVHKLIIGRKDIVSFPDFDLHNVPVKIDSGAYSCSIHCSSISKLDEDKLEVVFLDANYSSFSGEKIVFNTFKTKTVKSSNGIADERFFVFGSIRLFNKTFTTWFSLTARTGLKHPVLIGRKILNKRFLIDTSKTNLSFNFERIE